MHMRSNIIWSVVLLLALAGLMSVGACGNDDDDDGSDAAPANCDVPTAGLEAVSFAYSTAECTLRFEDPDPGIWSITVSDVQATSTDWQVGERFRVRGKYNVPKADVVSMSFDLDMGIGAIAYRSCGEEIVFGAANDFDVVSEILDVDADVNSNDLIFWVWFETGVTPYDADYDYENENYDYADYNFLECVIHLD
jgi:hypothetical protein